MMLVALPMTRSLRFYAAAALQFRAIYMIGPSVTSFLPFAVHTLNQVYEVGFDTN